MQFITKDEIITKIKENILSDILEEDEVLSGNTMLEDVEKVAIDEITSYIGNYYDADLIFSATGSTRNNFIMKMTIDIMLYELTCRLIPDNIPESRQIRYEQLKKDLLDISKGLLTPNLPKIDQDIESNSGIYFSYLEKNNTDY